MSEIYLTEHGTSIHLKGESVCIKKKEDLLLTVPLDHLSGVQIMSTVSLSTPVLKAFMRRGIPVSIYSGMGELLGQLSSGSGKNVVLRKRHYHFSENEEFCLTFSRMLMNAKFRGCIHTIEEGNRNKDTVDLREELAELRKTADKAHSAESMESLLGLEGYFSKKYFEAYGRLFSEEGRFNGRNRRPPRDPVNAVLSFYYTLVTNKITSLLDGHGLDPYIGFYHKTEYGRPSLSCDLIEPVRSVFVDRITLKLFNLKMVKDEDFTISEEEGCRMKDDTLKKVIRFYHEESIAERNLYFIKGNLMELISHLIQWTKNALNKGAAEEIGKCCS